MPDEIPKNPHIDRMIQRMRGGPHPDLTKGRPLPMPVGYVPPGSEDRPLNRNGLNLLADAMRQVVSRHHSEILTPDRIDTIYSAIRDTILNRQKEFALEGHDLYVTGGWNLDYTDYVFVVAVNETGPVVRMHLRPNTRLHDGMSPG